VKVTRRKHTERKINNLSTEWEKETVGSKVTRKERDKKLGKYNKKISTCILRVYVLQLL
jgi:hypothetical protein